MAQQGNSTKLQVGQWVRVLPHTECGDLRGGAVHSDMHEHRHNGYHKAQIESIASDGSVEVFVPGFGIDIVDITHLENREGNDATH